MKTKTLLRSLFVAVLLLLGSALNQLHAADVIQFTWKGSAETKSFEIRATSGKFFTVEWGNGTSDTFTGTTSNVACSQSAAYGDEEEYVVRVIAGDDCLITTCNLNAKSVTALDVSQAMALTDLRCFSNQLTSLDVSNNIALTNLSCYSNQLTSLDVSNNTALTYLSCYSNQLTSLDVSNNKALTNLRCNNNRLSHLDVSQNTKLITLYCYSTQLASLDVSNNTALIDLQCQLNRLTSLDVSNNTALIQLYCNTNQLTSLDVSNNTALTTLWCYSNQLTSLDVSNNTALTTLHCYSNQLPLSDLYAGSERVATVNNKGLGTQTHAAQEAKTHSSVSLAGQMTLGGVQTTIAVSKDGNAATEGTDYRLDYTAETITFLTAGSFSLTLTNTAITSHANHPAQVVMPITVTDATPDIQFTWKGSAETKSFEIRATSGKSFTVEWGNETSRTFTGIGTANTTCSQSAAYGDEEEYTVRVIAGDDCLITFCTLNSKSVTALDVSQATALTNLQCQSNQLTSLDVSNNTALVSLYCHSNQLTSLDVSNNIALTNLQCHSNQLTSLDISNNTALTTLHCYTNELTSLDISNNMALTTLSCRSNQLPLSDLYAASEQITSENSKSLGTQTHAAQEAKTHSSVSLAGEMTLGGVQTTFVVKKGNSTATEGTDYRLDYTAETITFLTAGSFSLTLTNTAITSGSSYPPQVVMPFTVISTDATLSGLTVSAGTLTPAFSADVTSYTVSVDNSVNSITIAATANHSKASVTGTGTKDLIVGDNPFEVVVTAEDGTTKTYTVTVTRETGVSIEDVDLANTIQVYPNPAADYFYIKGITEPTIISIYTLSGVLVLQQEAQPEEAVNISHLAAGTYLYKLSGFTGKLIKN